MEKNSHCVEKLLYYYKSKKGPLHYFPPSLVLRITASLSLSISTDGQTFIFYFLNLEFCIYLLFSFILPG